MSAIVDAAATLTAALATVPGLRVARDPSVVMDPPAAVLGPPSLEWGGMCSDPTSATWHVFVVVQLDERAVERLMAFVPLVAAAIDELPDAAVSRADPVVYPSAGTELPAYDIQVDVAL